MILVDVILPLAIADTYTYRVPESLCCPPVGVRVLVPLGSKQIVGIVAGEHTEPWDKPVALRDIIAVLDTIPIVSEEQLELWHWIADYYMCPLGDVMSAAMPAKVHDKQYTIEGYRSRVRAKSLIDSIEDPHPLTSSQQVAFTQIHEEWQQHPIVLLQGVTSSGKTEVYIHLIKEQMEQGRQVLYLVPEIALTTQLTNRLAKVFGDQLFVYHSRVSDARRMEMYRQLILANETEQKGRLILGARSAVFLPLKQLGLVIIDEEHEPSYKQQDPAPRYHARSVAIMIGQKAGAKVLLGTATPSVESRYNVERGKYGWVQMKERYQGLQLPHITIVDLKRQYQRKEMYGHFSDPLVLRMREELERGKQIILFQNRRGYAPYIQCVKCGAIPRCENCDVPLTLHMSQHRLVCHYCGYTAPLPNHCPTCGSELRLHGFGTERLEDEVKGLFPEARVDRMDWDTTRHKDDYQDIINRFARHEVDILIGTQMVTKGLHFDDVSLVAVLSADHLLSSPDFRSDERAYQMLEQVSGRAGRTEAQGEVIIQTFNPDHPLFDFLMNHDTEGIYQHQIEERQQYSFPPFYRQISLTLKHTNKERLQVAAHQLHERLKHTFGTRCSDIIAPLVPRVQRMHLLNINLRIEASGPIRRAKQMIAEHIAVVTACPECKGIQILADVDPL